ncbi:MAG: hypothetical protein CSA62_12415 [Planctomycetota bacterium]|nr:MAG: hypothetical protein CSA62_12415 [Planctomycetota bacterium]
MSEAVRRLWFPFRENTAVSTGILLGAGLRLKLGALLDEHFKGAPRVVLVDQGAWKHWGEHVASTLGPATKLIELPGGEACKTPEQWIASCRQLIQFGLPRNGYLVAIGGGATCDLAGAVAATHLRGIRIAQVPTTLLAMVDAGLGGKCAVNLPEGKNLLGVFHNPELLIVDPEFLRTLSSEELRAGFGEICKYAVGFSSDLYDTLDKLPTDEAHKPTIHYDNVAPEFWDGVLEYCLTIKGNIVSEDPREGEAGKRILLNLGHTSAHALETLAARRGKHLPHGIAVGLGLRVALELAGYLGRYPKSERLIAHRILSRFGQLERLPWTEAFPRDELLELLAHDKKRRNDWLRIILPLPRNNSIRYELKAEEFVERMRPLFAES